MEKQGIPPEVERRLKGWFMTFWGFIFAITLSALVAFWHRRWRQPSPTLVLPKRPVWWQRFVWQ